MTFVSKNPLVLPQSNSSPSSLPTGTCGLYPSSDGWYSIDASGNARRILINDTSDIGENAVAIGVNIDMEPNAACSQAFGRNLIVSSSGQTVLGENNVEDENGEYVVIVGNGQSEARSNAFALKKNGDGYFGGDVISQTGGKLSEKAEKTTVDEMSSELQKTAKLDTNNNFAGAQTISGTLTVNGDIVQNGESYISHAEEIYTKKDLIKTREGAVGGLGIDELTGIEAEKYDGENNGRLGFGADGTARVGDVGDEQPLLTRAEVADLTDGQVFVWDSTNKRAIGSSGYALKTAVAEDISTAKTEAQILAQSAQTAAIEYANEQITNETNQIAAALNIMQSDIDSKVDKVTGKGLSTNDYTTEDKNKVDDMYTLDGKLPYDRIPNPTVHGLPTGDVFEVNSIYDLPELASLTITLPSGSVGDWMQVGFISGATATNLTINATSTALISDYDFVPEINTIYTLFFDYGRLSNTAYGWRFSSAEYTYSEV